MLQAGQTILLPKPGHETAHLWVVLTAPDAQGQAMIVNFTTLRPHSDTTVVIQPGEHPFVTHATAVHYADARLTTAAAIAGAIASGHFRAHRDCSPALLQRLLLGALASPYTPEKIKRYLRQNQQQGGT
jgi:hypothetical protein